MTAVGMEVELNRSEADDPAALRKIEKMMRSKPDIQMNDKAQFITVLREEFQRWEELLSSVNEAQMTTPLTPSTWSVKDLIAHLRAWQQVSIARMEAALLNREPEMPGWLAGLDPDSESNLDSYNDRIYQANRNQPWSEVYRAWRDGFLLFLELAEAIPEENLMEAGKYPWLKGYPLSAVLHGSYEHHHIDHLEPLILLRQNGKL